MASWTDKQLDDAAKEHAHAHELYGKTFGEAVIAFKAGAVWGEKQKPQGEPDE